MFGTKKKGLMTSFFGKKTKDDEERDSVVSKEDSIEDQMIKKSMFFDEDYNTWIHGVGEGYSEELDLSVDWLAYDKMQSIELSDNQITKLILGDHPNLRSININNNKLTKIVIKYELPNLEELNCYDNKTLAQLDISNCPNLKRLDCSGCAIMELNTGNHHGDKLVELKCAGNNLGIIEEKFKSFKLSGNNLKYLDIRDNRIGLRVQRGVSNTSWISPLNKLQTLLLGNDNDKDFARSEFKGNYFAGSLKFLEKFSYLERLHIGNTKINFGLRYLPESLKEIEFESGPEPEWKKKSVSFENIKNSSEALKFELREFEKKEVSDKRIYDLESWREESPTAIFWNNWETKKKELDLLSKENEAKDQTIKELKTSLEELRKKNQEFSEVEEKIKGLIKRYHEHKKISVELKSLEEEVGNLILKVANLEVQLGLKNSELENIKETLSFLKIELKKLRLKGEKGEEVNNFLFRFFDGLVKQFEINETDFESVTWETFETKIKDLQEKEKKFAILMKKLVLKEEDEVENLPQIPSDITLKMLIEHWQKPHSDLSVKLAQIEQEKDQKEKQLATEISRRQQLEKELTDLKNKKTPTPPPQSPPRPSFLPNYSNKKELEKNLLKITQLLVGKGINKEQLQDFSQQEEELKRLQFENLSLTDEAKELRKELAQTSSGLENISRRNKILMTLIILMLIVMSGGFIYFKKIIRNLSEKKKKKKQLI